MLEKMVFLCNDLDEMVKEGDSSCCSLLEVANYRKNADLMICGLKMGSFSCRHHYFVLFYIEGDDCNLVE